MTASLLRDYFLAPTLVELTGVVILCLCIHIYIGIDPTVDIYLIYLLCLIFFLTWSEVTGKLQFNSESSLILRLFYEFAEEEDAL